MRKKKVEKFSVTKAVKANARERIGQPKPEHVIDPKMEAQRKEKKHKEKMDELIRGEG